MYETRLAPTIYFPIMQDLKTKGATDYVAMPLPFSNGQNNILTLTSDHPKGFKTANLTLVKSAQTSIGVVMSIHQRCVFPTAGDDW